MFLRPVYIASAVAILLLFIALSLLFKIKERSDDFIEIEDNPYEDNSYEEPKVLEELPELLTFYLIPKDPIKGTDLLDFFMNHQLKYSEKQKIFHAIEHDHKQFFIAMLSSPGTFDIKTMPQKQFKGLSFFTQPSSSHSPLKDFDRLCQILFDAKDIFQAQLQSEHKEDVSLDNLKEIREKISQHHVA